MKPVLPNNKILLAYLVAFIILAYHSSIYGADENSLPWRISADQITHQREPQKFIAEGKVILQQYRGDTPTGLEIDADRILYNVEVNSVDAIGNLHLLDAPDELWATEAQLNLAKQTGFFKQATMYWKDTNLSASAELIEKTATQSYHFVNGKFTSCPTGEDNIPDWSIWGRDVTITLNDYARIKHATFRVRDVPVFYLPYILIPVRTEKTSGLLFPEYSTSNRKGVGIIAPVFLNLAPSYDMTFYPGYYSKRGPVIGGEFRYIADFNSRGTLQISYLHDSLEDSPSEDYKADNKLRTNANRYWIRGKADHDFGNRLNARLDLDLVSDRDYLQEFRNGIIGFDQSNSYFLAHYNRGFQAETVDLRENSLQLSKVWTTTDLQAEIKVIHDVQDDALEITPPWAVPRIAYSGLLPFLQTPLDLTWDTEYVNYWRDEGVGAHRVDLFPQLNGPISFSPYLESSYLVGLRETMYFIETHDTMSENAWAGRDFVRRTFYNVLLTGATTLSRDYDMPLKKYPTFRHIIRPELSYLLVKGTDQADLPILDDQDRILEKSWLQYGLNNYFQVIRPNEFALFRSNFSTLKINQVYDIDNEDHPFSDIYFEFTVRGFENLFFRYKTTLSSYEEGITTYSLETQYKNRRGDRFRLDYRYKLHPDIDPPYFYSDAEGESLYEIRGNLETRLTQRFSFKFNTTYSLASNSTVNSTFSLVYHNPCWRLELAANKNSDDSSFYLLFSLTGIGAPVDFSLPEF